MILKGEEEIRRRSRSWKDVLQYRRGHIKTMKEEVIQKMGERKKRVITKIIKIIITSFLASKVHTTLKSSSHLSTSQSQPYRHQGNLPLHQLEQFNYVHAQNSSYLACTVPFRYLNHK